MNKTLKLFLLTLVALLAVPAVALSAAEKVKIDNLTVKTLPAEVLLPQHLTRASSARISD
jgi:hypothetical protein